MNLQLNCEPLGPASWGGLNALHAGGPHDHFQQTLARTWRESCISFMRAAVVMLALLGLQTRPAAQEISLPCTVSNMAEAADGSGMWFVCAPSSKAEHPRNESEAYWLATTMTTPVKIEDAAAHIEILPAPSGSRALIVSMAGSGQWKARLHNKRQRSKELPIDPSFVLWSADSRKIYFHGGSTVQADVWDILGIYDLNSDAVTRVKLLEPT